MKRNRKPKRTARPAKRRGRAARVERTTTKTVRRRAGPVERTTIQRVRKTNPRARRPQFVLVAQAAHGRARMHYTGTRFSNDDRPVMFPSLAALSATARDLRERFGRRLRKYSLYAEPHMAKR